MRNTYETREWTLTALANHLRQAQIIIDWLSQFDPALYEWVTQAIESHSFDEAEGPAFGTLADKLLR